MAGILHGIGGVMPVFIYEKDAFRKIVAVENDPAYVRQQRTFGDRSFFAFFQKWQEIYVLSTQSTTILFADMAIDVDGAGTIYGHGGWNRYVVYGSGEISFLRLQARDQDSTDRAIKEGFRVE